MQLRYYQSEAISKAIDHINKSPVIVLPTGAGKSIVIKEIASNINDNILVLQPNKEILEQNYLKYRQHSSDCAIFSASCNSKEINRVTYATIGSIVHKAHLFDNFQTIIIDECHLVDAQDGMYCKIINTLNTKIIGLTATPYRMHTTLKFGSTTKMITRTRPKLFNFIAYNVNPLELINNGFLSKLKYFNVKMLNTNELQQNLNKSEFTNQSINNMINNKKNDISLFLRDISSQHSSILVFSPSIDFSIRLANYLLYHNINCATIDSNLSKEEREAILTKFKQQKIKIVINVGVLTTGFDFPELDCIVMLRPTMSISLYYQMIGRGLRIADKKAFCTIYDLCQNVNRFGKIENFVIDGESGKENLFSFINGSRAQLTHINKYF